MEMMTRTPTTAQSRVLETSPDAFQSRNAITQMMMFNRRHTHEQTFTLCSSAARLSLSPGGRQSGALSFIVSDKQFQPL
jgi:hypothetical protein